MIGQEATVRTEGGDSDRFTIDQWVRQGVYTVNISIIFCTFTKWVKGHQLMGTLTCGFWRRFLRNDVTWLSISIGFRKSFIPKLTMPIRAPCGTTDTIFYSFNEHLTVDSRCVVYGDGWWG